VGHFFAFVRKLFRLFTLTAAESAPLHRAMNSRSPASLDDTPISPPRIPIAPPAPRPKVSEMLSLLSSPVEDERAIALEQLSEVVNEVYGDDGAELGRAVRQGGGIPLLSWLLADPSPDIQQSALLVLGNLCSDSVDPQSASTKHALLQCGGARALIACAYSDDDYTLVLACGALQNLCFDREWAHQVVRHNLQPRLEALLAHEDQMIVRYASGALTNLAAQRRTDQLSAEALAAVRQRVSQAEAERDVVRRATECIARAARAIPAATREQRRFRHKQRLAQVLGAPQHSRPERPSSSSSRSSSNASARSYVTACTNSTSSTTSVHRPVSAGTVPPSLPGNVAVQRALESV